VQFCKSHYEFQNDDLIADWKFASWTLLCFRVFFFAI